MKTASWILCVAASSVVLLTGCRKTEDPVDLGLAYFPNKVGAWIEYQVDSLWRDDLAAVRDSVSYRMKEKIVEAYTDPAGRQAWRVHRFIKNADDEWVVRDVWTRTSSVTQAELMEENLRRLKLSFPVRSARSWDINAFNTDDELMVAYRNVDQPWQTGALAFGQTVLVKNTVAANPIDKRNFEERYARNVGMVGKYWEETNTQYPNGAPRVKGWRLDMVIVAYGNE